MAPRPFDLPHTSPKHGRPINPAKVEWLNMGEEGISKAKLSAEVIMPNGEIVHEKFSIPLNYYQEDLDKLRRKEKKTEISSFSLT